MKAYLRLFPLDEPVACHEVTRKMTVSELLAEVNAPDWFRENGLATLNGNEILPENWHRVKLRWEAEADIYLDIVPGNRSTAILLASVALIAATGFIGAGGLGMIGSSLGIGALSAFGPSAMASGMAEAGVSDAAQCVIGLLALQSVDQGQD